MRYNLIPTPAPTLKRWAGLYQHFPGQSVLRALEYEAVSQIQITGQVLDYGGGRNAKYLSLLKRADRIESVNIDPDIDPTHLVEPGAPLPFEANTFDHVVCFNTLEHIYDSYNSCAEIFRVLKPGGRAIVTVPFIFRIHGHPDDYTRATPSWWRETAQRIGFSQLDLQALVWGRYTVAGSISGYRLFPRFQFHVAHLRDWIYSKIAIRSETYAGKRGQRIVGVASGWCMIITK